MEKINKYLLISSQNGEGREKRTKCKISIKVSKNIKYHVVVNKQVNKQNLLSIALHKQGFDEHKCNAASRIYHKNIKNLF